MNTYYIICVIEEFCQWYFANDLMLDSIAVFFKLSWVQDFSNQTFYQMPLYRTSQVKMNSIIWLKSEHIKTHQCPCGYKFPPTLPSLIRSRVRLLVLRLTEIKFKPGGFESREKRVKLFKSVRPTIQHSLTEPSSHSSAGEESVNQSSLRLILSRYDCRQKLFNIVCRHEWNSGGTAGGCERPVEEARRSQPSLPVTTQHVPGVESAHNAATLRLPTERKATRELWMHDLSSIQQWEPDPKITRPPYETRHDGQFERQTQSVGYFYSFSTSCILESSHPHFLTSNPPDADVTTETSRHRTYRNATTSPFAVAANMLQNGTNESPTITRKKFAKILGL